MKKTYYTVIPAEIRYDEKLKDKAKLLYGDISALSYEKGFCYASNSYFAKLYKVTKETISRLIKNLADNGYVEIEIMYKDKEIIGRRIYITKSIADEQDNNTSSKNNQGGINESVERRIDKNVKENNKLNNNKFTTKEYKKMYEKPPLRFNNFEPRPYYNDPVEMDRIERKLLGWD